MRDKLIDKSGGDTLKNKKILLAVCILLLVSVVALGCRPAQRPVPQTTPNQQNIDNRTTTENTVPRNDQLAPGNNRMTTDNELTTNDRMNTDNRLTTDNRTGTDDRATGNLSDRASRIEAEVTKLNDVKGATVVITGNTALVGINLTEGTKGDLNTEIKRQVEEAVQTADRDINRVSVTADPDLFTRIENIARDIGQGRPLSGFGQEVEELVRRITPGA